MSLFQIFIKCNRIDIQEKTKTIKRYGQMLKNK